MSPSWANADLYTAGTLSLEWLVDSSDEIFQIQLEADEAAADGFKLRVQKALKGNFAVAEFQKLLEANPESVFRLRPVNTSEAGSRIRFCLGRDPQYWSPLCKAISEDQWYLFARLEKGQPLPFQVFYAMNLNRPREFHSVAAVMSTGEAISKKEKVVAAVHARLALKRRLHPSCRRYLIDRWSAHKGIDQWAQESRKQGWFWSADEVASIRGGFGIRIENDYWDNPDEGDNDEDLWLCEAIVPADPEFYPVLARQFGPGKSPPDSCIYAMLNYPGEKTESLLDELVQRDSSVSLSARRVLTHLRYRENVDDPLNKKLIGRWNLYGNLERVELDFQGDQSCVVNTIPVKSGASTPTPLEGKGYWAVHDGRLWISRSHIRRGGDWVPAIRQFFWPKKILQSDDQTVVLEGGPKMARP